MRGGGGGEVRAGGRAGCGKKTPSPLSGINNACFVFIVCIFREWEEWGVGVGGGGGGGGQR